MAIQMNTLDGFSISGFRSFGPEETRISSLAQVNIFSGKNNCGKSNVLRFIKRLEGILEAGHQNAEKKSRWNESLDFHPNSGRAIRFGLQIKESGRTSSQFGQVKLELIAEQFSLELKSNDLWMQFEVAHSMAATEQSLRDMIGCIEANSDDAIMRLAKMRYGFYGGSPEDLRNEIANRMHQRISLKLKVFTVEAFRKIARSGGDVNSGDRLIERLLELQNPKHDVYGASREKFKKIEGFLQTVLNDKNVRLEIPSKADDIYVVIHDKVLPLDSLGTGIHQMVILAAAVTMESGSIFCIEEPELHCHPELQRQFLDYIKTQTDNQYFITSHSNAFFDVPDINIYRCVLDAATSRTTCSLAVCATDKHELLQDLGYRPSDILLANFVIWVEGPSDRIYLNHWLNLVDSELSEGLHYSIMFYGGSLRSHLCYEQGEEQSTELIARLIALAKLNRNGCMIYDSDQETRKSKIDEQKNRLESEFAQNGLMTWMTAGRMIENYVPIELLNRAISLVHPRVGTAKTWGQYADLTKLGNKTKIRKIEVARAVVDHSDGELESWTLDLKPKVDQLVDRIRKCSGLAERK